MDAVDAAGDMDMTSPLWSTYCGQTGTSTHRRSEQNAGEERPPRCSDTCEMLVPDSTSHNMQVMSPDDVNICSPCEPMNRQQDK